MDDTPAHPLPPCMLIFILHSTSLHHNTLYQQALYYNALTCTAQYHTAPSCNLPHCIVLHYTELHCTALHCTAPQGTRLRFIVRHFPALHSNRLSFIAKLCTVQHTEQCRDMLIKTLSGAKHELSLTSSNYFFQTRPSNIKLSFGRFDKH